MTTANENVSAPTDDDAVLGPIIRSPDPRRWRDRWLWVQGHCPDLLQRAYASAVVPADVPGGYAAVHLNTLKEQLRTPCEATASAVLAEAESAAAEPQERIDGAERRATTLQGTLAIAASVTVAGAGLVLRDDTIDAGGWRTALAATFAAAVIALLACALRAAQVTGRIFQFEEPGFERIAARAQMSASDAMTSRAAELLRAAAVADVVGSIKVGLLRAAAGWFRLALVLLGAVAALLLAYALVHANDGVPPRVVSTPGQSTVTQTVPAQVRTSPQQPHRSTR